MIIRSKINMFPQNKYFNSSQTKQLSKKSQYNFTPEDEIYFSYGFQKFPEFYKKMKQTNISAQDCIKCNNKILTALVNDDSILPAIFKYVDWCRAKVGATFQNNNNQTMCQTYVKKKEIQQKPFLQSPLQYKMIQFIRVSNNQKHEYNQLIIQKFSVEGHNCCLGFDNCNIGYFITSYHNSKIRFENVIINRLEINGHNSYIVINNSTIEEFYNGGFNTEIVIKNNSKIKTESGKSYKTHIN